MNFKNFSDSLEKDQLLYNKDDLNKKILLGGYQVKVSNSIK